MNEIINKTLKEKITYSVISERQPVPSVFHDTFKEAVEWAEKDQPAYRPYFIVERTEHFEICGVVGENKVGEEDS